MQSPARILLRGPNPVGDLVMATASFADVRRSFPAARITLLVRRGRDALLDGLDCFDEVLIDDSHKGIAAAWKLVRRLRRDAYDFAILFTHSLRTALVIALAGIPARIGYRKGGQGLLLTQCVEPVLEGRKWKPRPMPEIYADLCAAVGVERGDGRPRLAVPAALEERAAEARRELGIVPDERLIGLAPGASFGASKLWPTEHFARLADLLNARRGLRSLIFAAPGEAGIADDLSRRMRSPHINTSAKPLGLDLLKPFIRDLELLVTTDSGPRHIAVAFGVPAAVVMGPTDPRWTNANLESTVVVRHDVPCGPCHLQVCPIDHRCMTGISAEEVLSAIDALEARLTGARGAAAGRGTAR